jgi:hypothetical protein
VHIDISIYTQKTRLVKSSPVHVCSESMYNICIHVYICIKLVYYKQMDNAKKTSMQEGASSKVVDRH